MTVASTCGWYAAARAAAAACSSMPTPTSSRPRKVRRIHGKPGSRTASCSDAARGQVALLFLVLNTLDRLGVKLAGDVLGHLVVEEENGGNGSLAMARRGE